MSVGLACELACHRTDYADRSPPFELKPELPEEINCPAEVIDDDSYVIHPFERHLSTVHNVA